MKRLPASAEYYGDALGAQHHDTTRAGTEAPGRGLHGQPALVWSCRCAACQINRSAGSLRQGAARQHPDDPDWVGLYWVVRPGSTRRGPAAGETP